MVSPGLDVMNANRRPLVPTTDIAKPAASLAGWPARATDVANGSVVARGQIGPALVEVPILATEPACRVPYDQPIRRLRQIIEHLAHEQNEALCAIANYLGGVQKLLLGNDPPCTRELEKAVNQAMGQTARAAEVVRRLRGAVR